MKLGDFNKLTVVKRVDFGVYLDGGREGEILLPAKYVPEGTQIGDELDVFLYLDSEERLIATTETPLCRVGDFAFLKVAWVNQYGTFLNWGLPKDLFCPFREQKQRMVRGQRYYVYVMEDEKTHRLMATSKVERYQKKTGYELSLDFAEVLLQYLREHDGQCELGDKSPSEAIAARFGVSKKVYKKAIGDLYRRHLITITDDGISLV